MRGGITEKKIKGEFRTLQYFIYSKCNKVSTKTKDDTNLFVQLQRYNVKEMLFCLFISQSFYV